MTFREMRTQQEVYPTGLDIFQADKEAINSWFDARNVVDNDKFVVFFQRVLVRDYGRYRELLRTQPDISKFDWLVQQYMESQTYEKGINTNETTGSTSTTGSTESTSNGTSSATRQGNETAIYNGTGTSNDTTSDTVNHTTTNSGTDTTSHTASESREGSTSVEASGSDSTETDGHNNVKGLTRESPMSISYGSGGAHIDRESGNTGALEWEYPSAQSETDTRDNSDSTTTYGRKDETETTDSVSQEAQDTTTHGHIITEAGSTSGSRQGTTTDQHSNTVNHNDTDTGTTTGSNTSESTSNGTSSTSTNGSNQHLTQHVNTGRSVDTATLLSQAQAYIMNSSAFEWLYKQLDVCFMGVYNDDEIYNI